MEDYDYYEPCKYCKYCDQFLPLYNFSKNINTGDGLTNKCKQCQSEYHKYWKTVNREGYKEYQRNYFKQRREEDPKFRVVSALRSRLSNLVSTSASKGVSNNTHSNTLSAYLGCSDQFFYSWLQFQFDEYMNWDNYGSYWHFDHVKPVAMYDHEYEDDIYECWNWKNLRPLEASENRYKSDKVDDGELYEEQKKLSKEFKKLYKQLNLKKARFFI